MTPEVFAAAVQGLADSVNGIHMTTGEIIWGAKPAERTVIIRHEGGGD